MQGEVLNSDSLSIRTEYDYYPLSVTEVKVIIINHSHYEYDCGEGYSLTYYNKRQKREKPKRNVVIEAQVEKIRSFGIKFKKKTITAQEIGQASYSASAQECDTAQSDLERLVSERQNIKENGGIDIND